MRGRLALSALLCAAWGCGDDGATTDTDASSMCETEADCDDGNFCNGTESCEPGSSTADDRGCVSGTPPCSAAETCDEGLDICMSDCADADMDGTADQACGGSDCDDSDPGRFPGNTEVCDVDDVDEDCDPSTFGVRDGDADGFADASCCNGDNCGPDCNDTSAAVHPGEAEACDGLDNDCDGTVDETVLNTYIVDADNDSFGDDSPDAETTMACFTPEGFADRAGDCDDSRGEVNPGQRERCDMPVGGAPPLDENCDGEANPSALCECAVGDPSRLCSEGGFDGRCAGGTQSCNEGMWDDCSIAPIGETCNDMDDDCDGLVDEMLRVACFEDGDNDGYASDPTVLMECPNPPGSGVCPFGTTNRAPLGADIDCNDGDESVFPGATERCNMVNDDCDMAVDEDAVDRDSYCLDSDGDMFGDPAVTMMSCSPPTNYVSDCRDCDDDDTAVRPNATEICDGIDNNCGGGTDENPAAANDCFSRSMDAAGTTFACQSGGMCAVTNCPTDERDCNGDFLDGCEIFVRNNLSHCGSCGTTCALECAGLSCDDIIAVAIGQEHACGIRDSGGLVCWGRNADGQVGDGTMTQRARPVEIGVSNVVDVAAGFENTCIVNESGQILCWGDNSYDQTGQPTGTTTPNPSIVGTVSNATDVAVGRRHGCAVAGGNVVCWGDNQFGQLGTGNTSEGPMVRTVRNPANTNALTGATAVAAGTFHTCAIVSGSVYCWGFDDDGELGDSNDAVFSRLPVQAGTITDAQSIAAAGGHTCVRRAGGSIWCWGLNASGQIDDSGTDEFDAPVMVLASAVEVATGPENTCARLSSGAVQCWGINSAGQIGNGTVTMAITAPTAVTDLDDAVEIGVGFEIGCAVRSSGPTVCWGSDANEKLGDGNGMTDRAFFVDVETL